MSYQSTESEMLRPPPGPPVERRPSTVKRKWRKKLLYIAACTRLIGQQPEPPKGWIEGTKIMVLGSKMNVLLLFGVVIPFVSDPAVTFSCACAALLPLAALLGDVTEKVAYHTSETIGGLLNATFGNATEALVSIFALKKGLLRVVQVSLLGSVLSNMLLVLGSAFVAAGLRVKIAHFNRTAATANTSLLLVAVLALLVPAMLSAGNEITTAGMQAISRFTAILMLLVYISYLNFQLSSHSKIFDDGDVNGDEAAPEESSKHSLGLADIALVALDQKKQAQQKVTADERKVTEEQKPSSDRRRDDEEAPLQQDIDFIAPTLLAQRAAAKAEASDEEVVLRLEVALGMLAVVTVLVAGFSEVLTGSLEGFAVALNFPDAFVGFVLLPLVGNAAEHATAISMAYRSKIDLAIAVALGSSTQIALFVLPLMVILGWIIGQPLALDFGSFQTACCALSVLIVAAQAQLGDVHYLNGLCLVVAYIIIAIAFLYIDETPDNVAS